MSRPTILIADDDDRLLKVMTIRFEKAGFHVISTWNGRRAFELIRENKPDLLILDVDIPGYDGFNLVEMMDQIPTMNATPVIYNERCGRWPGDGIDRRSARCYGDD